MDKLWKLWTKEPALIVSATRAVLVCAVGFGLDLTAEQVAGVVVAMESLFALVTRASVYSPATVTAIKGRRHGGAVGEDHDAT